jgi:CheY-like chemotaxis protein
VDDDLKSAELIRVQLEAEGFIVIHASSAEEAFDLAVHHRPALITLDILLPDMDGWELLARLKSIPDMQRIPVVIMSIVADPHKGFSLGAAAVLQKPITRAELYETLADLGLVPTTAEQSLKVLIVDDDPKAVELIAVRLTDVASSVLRSYGGAEAIDLALKERPDVIVLDLMMPDVNGFEVVEELQRHPSTQAIPIIVVTAKQLTDGDRSQLRGFVVAIMEKALFNSDAFLAELRRAMAGHPLPRHGA